MAQTTQRVLLTEDRDFGELVVRKRIQIVGVLLVQLDRLSRRVEAERVLHAVQARGNRIAGSLLVIEPNRVRIRPLTPSAVR